MQGKFKQEEWRDPEGKYKSTLMPPKSDFSLQLVLGCLLLYLCFTTRLTRDIMFFLPLVSDPLLVSGDSLLMRTTDFGCRQLFHTHFRGSCPVLSLQWCLTKSLSFLKRARWIRSLWRHWRYFQWLASFQFMVKF